MATNTSDEDRTPVRPKLQGSSGVEGSGAKGDPSFRLRQPDELPTANDVVNINPDTTPLTGHVGQRMFTGNNPAASHRYVSVYYPDVDSSSIGGAGEEVTIPEPTATHPWAMTVTGGEDDAILDILDGQIFDDKLSVVSLLDENNTLGRALLTDYEPEEGHLWVLEYDFSEIFGVDMIEDGVAKFRYVYFNTTEDYVPTNTDLTQFPPSRPTITYYPLGIIKYDEEEESFFVQQIATTNLCATTICYSGANSKSLTPV